MEFPLCAGVQILLAIPETGTFRQRRFADRFSFFDQSLLCALFQNI